MARILLVEDDVDVRPLLEHVLAGAGHDITAVETVTNARILIERSPYDLVLTDGMLVDGTGLDVAETAQARGLPVLILTGYALQLPPERLQQFDYLLKPVRPAELIEAVERFLRQRDGGADVVPFPKSS
jgi:DNA-binding NtrC family response regulator